MANYDTCVHFYATGPRGPATLCTQVSLATPAGSHDGLTGQKMVIKQGLVSSAFGANGSAPVCCCARLAFSLTFVLRQPVPQTLAFKTSLLHVPYPLQAF